MLFARKRRATRREDPRGGERRRRAHRRFRVRGEGGQRGGERGLDPGGGRAEPGGVARDAKRRGGGGCRRSVFRRACFRNLFVGPLPFVVRAAVRVPLAPPPFPIAREFAAQTLEQLGVRVGVRGPGRLRPRRRGRVEVFVREAPRDDRPQALRARLERARVLRRARPRRRLRPRGEGAPRPAPAAAPAGEPRARGDGADEARDDPGEEKRRRVRLDASDGFDELGQRPQRPRSNVPVPLRAEPRLVRRQAEQHGDAVPQPGKPLVLGEAGDVARVVEGADDRSQRGDAGEPDVLVLGGGLRARAVALAREAEDGDDGEEEVQGALARAPARPRARRRRGDAAERRLERAPAGRAHPRGHRGGGGGGDRGGARGGGERRVRGRGRSHRVRLAAHRARHGREDVVDGGGERDGIHRANRRRHRVEGRRHVLRGAGGRGGGGRLHGDRRRSAATIRKDEEGGALARDPPTPSPRGAPLKTPRRARSEKKSFRVIEAGKLVPTQVSAVSYWMSAGAWRRSRASQPTARSAMASALGKRPREAGGAGSGKTCVHGKGKGGYLCKECPGKGICEHGRQRKKCKECGGSQICEHGRERSQCKECGGSGICEHGRQRSKCKECGGSGICEHGRERCGCKECGGSEHLRAREAAKKLQGVRGLEYL